jgi:hypothetical protein
MIVKKLPRNASSADSANINRENFSLELGIEKIPVGFVLAWVEQLAIVSCPGAGRYVALIDKNVLALFIGVFMFAFPPFRRVRDLRQNQRRFDWVEHLPKIKNLIQRISTAIVNVDEILAGPPFSRYARREIGAGPGNVSNFNFRVTFLKHSGFNNGAVTADRDCKLSFLLGRLHRAFPLRLPVWFSLGSVSSLCGSNKQANQDYGQHRFHRKFTSPPRIED